MSRINMDPILTLSDGSYLVVSTVPSKEGHFSCALYRVRGSAHEGAAFQVLSNHVSAETCLYAQQHAYSYALGLYPGAGLQLKKPPYLIWSGPRL
jgi:hypothetical protein